MSRESHNAKERAKRIGAKMGCGSFAAPSGSAALWKRLAMQIAEEAQVVLDNAHWEVSYGSGDLRRTIKAVKRLQYTESETPQNVLAHRCRARDVHIGTATSLRHSVQPVCSACSLFFLVSVSKMPDQSNDKGEPHDKDTNACAKSRD